MTRRAWALDAAIAAVMLSIVQLEVWQGTFSTHRQGPHWAQATAYGVAATALLVRRARPLLCVAVVCGAMTLEFAIFGSAEGFGVAVPTVLAAYAVASMEERRRALVGLVIVVAFGVCWSAFDPVNTHVRQYVAALVWTVLYVAAWLLGAYLRARRLYVAQLVREREEKAATAVAEERARIARELHDVLGHSVSVMTVQASAVRRLLRPGQDKERTALEAVETTGREALTEMRRMVHVLRRADDAPDLAPPPSLANLERLLDGFRRAGLAVELCADSPPAPLSAGLDSAAYRVIQEALTNTLKHAGAKRVVVELRHTRDALHINIRDDGIGLPTDFVPGNGLVGMRERVEIFGGTLATGQGGAGGFEICAELPLVGS
jgi:signal transduction histidine kinase